MEEWVSKYLYGDETLECNNCWTYVKHQKVHMYVDVDRELDETLCEKCWEAKIK